MKMRSKRLLRILALSLLATSVTSKKAIPSYLHLCSRSDPDISGCVKKSVEDLRPQLAAGMPDINVPPIEPLYIKELTAAEGRGVKVVTRDLYVKGCKDFLIESMKVDLGKKEYDFVVTFPQLSINGKYNVDGKILMIPVKGEGEALGEVSNAKGVVKLKSETGADNSIRFTEMDMNISVEKGKMQLSNLFGGEKLLGDIVNAAINLNFQTFFHELKPLIEDVLKKFILESANKIVDGLDYDEIFLA